GVVRDACVVRYGGGSHVGPRARRRSRMVEHSTGGVGADGVGGGRHLCAAVGDGARAGALGGCGDGVVSRGGGYLNAKVNSAIRPATCKFGFRIFGTPVMGFRE